MKVILVLLISFPLLKCNYYFNDASKNFYQFYPNNSSTTVISSSPDTIASFAIVNTSFFYAYYKTDPAVLTKIFINEKRYIRIFLKTSISFDTIFYDKFRDKLFTFVIDGGLLFYEIDLKNAILIPYKSIPLIPDITAYYGLQIDYANNLFYITLKNRNSKVSLYMVNITSGEATQVKQLDYFFNNYYFAFDNRSQIVYFIRDNKLVRLSNIVEEFSPFIETCYIPGFPGPFILDNADSNILIVLCYSDIVLVNTNDGTRIKSTKHQISLTFGFTIFP
jgi:hypothetical protein